MHYAEDKTPDPLKSEEGASRAAAADNPYVRKEVSYACETGEEICGVLGGIFRRVREARELGERYGKENDGEIDCFVLCLCVFLFVQLDGCVGMPYFLCVGYSLLIVALHVSVRLSCLMQ